MRDIGNIITYNSIATKFQNKKNENKRKKKQHKTKTKQNKKQNHFTLSNLLWIAAAFFPASSFSLLYSLIW